MPVLRQPRRPVCNRDRTRNLDAGAHAARCSRGRWLSAGDPREQAKDVSDLEDEEFLELARKLRRGVYNDGGFQWQPIETAPKDGTWILGLNNKGDQSVIIWMNLAPDWAGQLRAGWVQPFGPARLSAFWNGSFRVTHWMHLPAPPPVVR